MRNDELRPAVIALLRVVEGVEKRLHVVAVDLLNVESIGFESRSGVFALRHLRRGVERDRVAIVNQNQIIETEMSGERARFRGYAFLQTAVAANTDAMLIENAVFARIEPRRRHFHRHRDSDCVADPLSKRTGGAFNSRRVSKFRMSGRFRMQLPETFDLRHRQAVTAHMQPRVEKHTAVAGRENKVIAPNPARFIRIIF